MKAACTIMIVFLAMLAGGCPSGDRQAAELLETARFEEKQNNLEHATKLYGEILKKHPSSPAEQDAAARLAELNHNKP